MAGRVAHLLRESISRKQNDRGVGGWPTFRGRVYPETRTIGGCPILCRPGAQATGACGKGWEEKPQSVNSVACKKRSPRPRRSH